MNTDKNLFSPQRTQSTQRQKANQSFLTLRSLCSPWLMPLSVFICVHPWFPFLFIVEDFDGFEFFAFEHFQRGPAAGRDVTDLAGEAELLDGRRAVAAADDAHGV